MFSDGVFSSQFESLVAVHSHLLRAAGDQGNATTLRLGLIRGVWDF